MNTMTVEQPGEKQWNKGNTIFNTTGTILGLAISTLSADFLKPVMNRLPLLLICFSLAGLTIFVLIRKAQKQTLVHWVTLTLALGLAMAVTMFVLSKVKTPPGHDNEGTLAVISPKIRQLQSLILPLAAKDRLALAALDGNPNAATTASPLTLPDVRPTLTADQMLLERLGNSLKGQDADAKEAAAQDAISKAKDPETFRRVLRIIYRTGDPVLREMVVLRELKALEGKQIPLTVISDSDINQAASQNELAGFLIGSSISIKSVDLTSASFDGSFNTGHSAGLSGSVNSQGVQFSSAVTGPGFGAFALQVRLIPQDNLRLTGTATGVYKGTITAAVELGLPL